MRSRRAWRRTAVALEIGALLVVTSTGTATSSWATRAVFSPPPRPSVSTAPGSSTSVVPAPSVTFQVVALGDSVTAGSQCDCEPFPNLYTKGLAERENAKAQLINDGEPGETSADVLSDLSSKQETEDVAAADVVLLTIGANDFETEHDTIGSSGCGGQDSLACTRDGTDQLRNNLDAILGRIEKLRAGRPTTILATGYWNVFEDGDVARGLFSSSGLQASDQLTRKVNDVIARAADRAGATYVDLYAPFKDPDGQGDPTDLLAPDGDHPNAAGHQLIARQLLAADLRASVPHT